MTVIKGQLFINGEWTQGSGELFNAIDGAKNQIYWTGNAASHQQIDLAISSARQAFTRWAQTPLAHRQDLLKAYAEALTANKAMLTAAIAQDTGKPLWEAATEVAAMVGKIALSIKSYLQRTGVTEAEMPGATAFTRHKPHGVLAVFGPYNFPGHLPNGHIVPAILAGNTVVFKPSELTPNTAQLMLKIWQQVGLPNGVINLLQGQLDCAQYLSQHKSIDGLLFTGSSQVGCLLHQQFAGQPQKVLALEMGGNNPLVVEQVANVDAAVHAIIQSAFITSGQRCTCARRLYVPQGLQGDDIIARLVEVSQAISVNEYDVEPQPFMGSLINHQAAQQVLSAQQMLQAKGANTLLAGRLLKAGSGLLSPAILDVTEVSELEDKEIFGPLLQITRYQDFDQAIELANDSQYGLSAGLLSDNPDKWQQFYALIRAGIVNWNRAITGASGSAPFGGVGLSGNHNPSAYYAADYCAYPVASVEAKQVVLPSTLSPGLTFN
ncbi:succinylglutamate-semialdehyde dehydrogenase [Saccharobesus litoralis]|uniref:N-succinylglutamate 5-semialdehyde dehydrogenase n=1 Tax=Saccharobesus litoralis TaxID=2172099 RepID=A0A2S0VVZ0_9ALTE|nr:succinylglutamate-semialdehyde dehydrogenase [Saccharobesus litoralis]AWB68381.1 succinylglutamate-semialdehyde dehydrogenase [Saccharobesus litoralis]